MRILEIHNVPQPEEGSTGHLAPIEPGYKVQYMNLPQLIKVPGLAYFKEVLEDIKNRDYSWGVAKKVLEYANYLKQNPQSLKGLPPIIIKNGKLTDGSHRISALYLLSNLLDTTNKLWNTQKLKVFVY